MPKMHEAIRDRCLAQGGQERACKTKAAKIYNAHATKKRLPHLSPKHHGLKDLKR